MKEFLSILLFILILSLVEKFIVSITNKFTAHLYKKGILKKIYFSRIEEFEVPLMESEVITKYEYVKKCDR